MKVQAQTTEILIQNNIQRWMWIWDSDSFYTQRLQGGPYQKQNLVHLRDLVGNPKTIIDIGMNIGMNTWEYATFAQRVIGFEPVPQTYDLALKNIRMNQNSYSTDRGWYKNADGSWASLEVTARIETHNVALGYPGCPPSTEIHIKKNDGHNRIANDTGEFTTVTGRDIKKNTGYPRVQIPQYTLDSYGYTDVDIIKVDTEGYELFVLEGAEQTIQQNRPIVQVECVEIQPRAFGRTIQELYDWFTSRDYVITTVDGEVLSNTWQHIPRRMDRFMIPSEYIK